ncbi:MAG: glycosyltransferase [Thermoanaerobaculia bacterium]
MSTLFVLATAMLCYVYGLYLGVLRLLCLLAPRLRPVETRPGELPTLTVLVTVRNEEAAIGRRLDNILACDYPRDRLQVIVASDGSTDGTDEIVRSLRDARVVLFTPPAPGGKTRAQNQALAAASGDVVVFTDAGTTFAVDCLVRLVEPFADSLVGAVDGHVLFSTAAGNIVSENQGLYWSYELEVRKAETELGILAVASGACLAVRRELLRPMPESTGEDCYLPLDVVRQKHRVVHCPGAVAHERMEHEGAREFGARCRMTLRGWQGTWMFPELLDPFRNPGHAFGLWSHKLLRWLSPVFLIVATAAAAAEAAAGSRPFLAISIAFGAFYVAGLVGWWCDARRIKARVVGTPYSFLLANAGFLVGTTKALLGKTIVRYR